MSGHITPNCRTAIAVARPSSHFAAIRDLLLRRLNQARAPSPVASSGSAAGTGTGDTAATAEKATGRVVGFHVLNHIHGETDIQVGYALFQDAWGKGYATEGSRALIRKGFAELGVRRVVAETMTVNTASRRVMEKAGLTYVRTLHQGWPEHIEGSEHGDVEYALTKADWERRQVTECGRL